jgi:hypothetical protein
MMCHKPSHSSRREERNGRKRKYISYNRKPIFSVTGSRIGQAHLEDPIILLREMLLCECLPFFTILNNNNYY